MIKANQLRIGTKLNYISAEGDVLVSTIDDQDIKWCVDDNVGFNLVHKPIELTEEILLKCGFKHETMYIIKNLYLIEYGDFYFVLYENNGYYHVKLSNHSFGHEKQVGLGIIKHLHQLQNLYFALTNEDIQINL